jgi:hypothetical protein
MCSKETLRFCSSIEKGSAVKRLALIAIIAASNVYSQDFYFDSDFYHEIDCSVEDACYISSYEKGLVWDSKINMDEIRRTTDLGRVYYNGKYTGSSLLLQYQRWNESYLPQRQFVYLWIQAYSLHYLSYDRDQEENRGQADD